MLKKLLLFGTLLVCVTLFVNMTGNNSGSDHGRHFVSNYRVINGDAVSEKPGPIIHRTPHDYMEQGPYTILDNVNSTSAVITELSSAADFTRSTYDYQSNGMVQQLVQDPNSPANLYAVYMTDPNGASGFPDRRSSVFASSDHGATWTFIGQAPAVRSGYPSITVLSDGREVVSTHTTDGGSGTISTLYVDAAGGAGTFTMLKPLSAGSTSDEPVWGKVVSTSSVSNTRKVVLIASTLSSDSCYTNCATNLSSSSFSGWSVKPDISNAEAYYIARASNGKIGVVYVGDDSHFPADLGNVYLIESTDDGLTWGARQTVWQTNFSTDSVGCIRSCSVCYRGTTPMVMAGVTTIDPATGGYYPNYKAKTVYWSPGVNGGNPVTVDTCWSMQGSNPQGDVFLASSRGVLGTSSDGNAIYAAWSRSRLDTSSTGTSMGNNFFDVYFAWSSDNGATWHPTKISNPSGPVRDCRYVSISPTNAVEGPNHIAHLVFQQDSVPGSFVQGADISKARFMYAKVTVTDPIGIHPVGTEIPKNYSLGQNYPNPFNPTTKIRFELPKNDFVTLKIYDATGRLVAQIVNENLSAGVKEVDWNAVDMPSGVYFYEMRAGSFVETKKMILVK